MNIRFYHAKIMLLDEAKRPCLIEGELWVKGNRIVYVGDGSDTQPVLEQESPLVWERQLDCKGNLLMPGFKNAHTHTAMTFVRTVGDDLPLQEWLTQQIFPREDCLTPDDVYWLDMLGIMEYLTSGVTSNFDMYFFPTANAKASCDAGFRTVLVPGFNNFGAPIESVEENFLAVNAMGDLVHMTLGFHAEYTTSMERMKDLADLAQKYKSPVFLHNSETEREVRECRVRWGKSPTQLTEELGMYAYGGGGYHCVWFDDEDYAIYKRRGLTAVTNPASNLKLASGIADIDRFLREEISLAIGTDGASSNNALDMFREMYLTTALAKVKSKNAAAVPAEDVLYMATAGGAHAMGLEDCDSIAPGKKADLILIDLEQPNMQPENDILRNLVYAGSKQNVKMTMVDGKILYEDGAFDIGFDPKEIYAKANAITRRINEQSGLNI